MPIPVLTALIIIFIAWIQYEIRKTNRSAAKQKDSFWQKENSANLSRRKDISQLDYITLDFSVLPMEDNPDDTINSYRDTIRSLSDKKILNLSGLTNTELKLRYGAANINQLSEYDNNFTILVSMLQKWAERLYSFGYQAEARAVLEYAVFCHTDVTKSYKLLAAIYKEQDIPEKIDALIDIIQKSELSGRQSLVDELKEHQNL